MIWLLLIFLTPAADGQATLHESHYIQYSSSEFNVPICTDNQDIIASFKTLKEPRNQYTIKVYTEIRSLSRMILRFDSEASLKLIEPTGVQISEFPGHNNRSNQFIVTFIEETSYLRIQVFGPTSGDSIPYVLSVILNDENICMNPSTGYFNNEIKKREKKSAKNNRIDEACGRRKVVYTELTIQGQPTQPGDWPWHVTLLRANEPSPRYICGGTLLSKNLVLTAAHCATIKGNPVVPNSLRIILGKYNLSGGDITEQEKTVFEIIVHPEFDEKSLNNDIALIRFKSEAVFDDYVQPACLWHTALPAVEDFGTVAGWGLDIKKSLSSTLLQKTVAIVSELTCLKSDPVFFHKILNTHKFCAGFANGTSICNGDSGGGLMIFVPHTAGDSSNASGAWYVRGIVSLAPSRTEEMVCDPHQYTLFTDVERYTDWLLEYLN